MPHSFFALAALTSFALVTAPGSDTTDPREVPVFGTAATAVFVDDFQDGDFTSPPWVVSTTTAGPWSVIADPADATNGVLSQGATGANNESYAVAGDSTWTDYAVQAQVKPLAWASSGGLVRVYGRYSPRTWQAYYVMLNASEEALPRIRELLPGMGAPSVLQLAEPGQIAVHAAVDTDEIWDLLPPLKAAGASYHHQEQQHHESMSQLANRLNAG